MATPTYVPLGTITLSSTDTEIVFSSIPATYRDLIVVVQGTTNAASNIRLRLNNDSSNNSYVGMWGTGSSTVSGANTNNAFIGALYPTQSVTMGQIFDYAQTDKQKSILGRGGGGNDVVWAFASRWASTVAVTSVAVSVNNPAGENFNSGTTFSLYGIAG